MFSIFNDPKALKLNTQQSTQNPTLKKQQPLDRLSTSTFLRKNFPTMKIPTPSALFLPLTGLLLLSSPSPAAAGPAVGAGCGALCITAAATCHAIGHSTISFFSAGLLTGGTVVMCHAAFTSCMQACVVAAVAPTP